MDEKYITISQLTRYIKYKIDNDVNLGQVFIKGEISNFKAHSRGHYYFTLKDETSRINAIMFASQTKTLKFMPEDGMKVLVTGKISVYEATGGYQIYVSDMIEDGVGNLYVAYEQLKKKLEKEGLFDTSKKKKIPRIPTKIGVITAPTGAAIRDILSTIKRRFPLTEVLLFPALVQGKEAASSIVSQIKNAENYDIDTLIVGRGGGSIEDMWCFNEEEVAYAIYNCKIPVISAVGHEIDFTIADFVADLRAPTPTGAAELAVPDINEIVEDLKYMDNFISSEINRKINTCEREIKYISESKYFVNVLNLFDSYKDRINIIEEKIENQIKNKVTSKEKELKYIENHLESLNPNNILSKGYSIIYKDGKAITDITELNKEDNINIKIKGGEVAAKIEEVKENGK